MKTLKSSEWSEENDVSESARLTEGEKEEKKKTKKPANVGGRNGDCVGCRRLGLIE